MKRVTPLQVLIAAASNVSITYRTPDAIYACGAPIIVFHENPLLCSVRDRGVL